METLDYYRQIIQDILAEYSTHKPAYGDIEMEVIFDRNHDRYQLVCTGWNQQKRIYGSLIHIDLKGNKIWIENDGTEVGIANLLVERGVDKNNIVLAYQAPIYGNTLNLRSGSCKPKYSTYGKSPPRISRSDRKSLGVTMSSIILSFVGSQDPYSNNTNQEGSIVTLITHLLTINQPIKQVILLHTDTTTQNAIDTKEWLESNPANLSPDSITLRLVDPTLSADPVNLLLAAQESRNAIDLAHSQMDSQDTLEFNASSGTPVMKSVWSVLQAAGYAPHSRIWQVRNPKEMRPNQDRVFTTDVATLKDEFDRKVIAQQVQDYNYNGAAITLKESNLYRPEIAALLVYGYQRLALNFDQAFSAIDPLREQIDRCWISEITPLRQKQGKALLLEAYFNALLRLKMRQYADFLVALFRLQEQILYYLVQDVIGLEISGKAQEKERSCRLIEEVEDGKLFRFLENYKLPKGGKLDIYRGMSRYVYQGIVAYYPRFSKIIPLIEFLNSYCDLRNDFVHGFVGVSEIEDEPMLLTNLNHLMRQITQVPDQNPFDRLNQDILNSLRTS